MKKIINFLTLNLLLTINVFSLISCGFQSRNTNYKYDLNQFTYNQKIEIIYTMDCSHVRESEIKKSLEQDINNKIAQYSNIGNISSKDYNILLYSNEIGTKLTEVNLDIHSVVAYLKIVATKNSTYLVNSSKYIKIILPQEKKYYLKNLTENNFDPTTLFFPNKNSLIWEIKTIFYLVVSKTMNNLIKFANVSSKIKLYYLSFYFYDNQKKKYVEIPDSEEININSKTNLTIFFKLTSENDGILLGQSNLGSLTLKICGM